MIGSSVNPKKYDFVIGNQPYMKISKSSPEAMAMPEHIIHLNGDQFMGPRWEKKI